METPLKQLTCIIFSSRMQRQGLVCQYNPKVEKMTQPDRAGIVSFRAFEKHLGSSFPHLCKYIFHAIYGVDRRSRRNAHFADFRSPIVRRFNLLSHLTSSNY
jgi:hypothetical protein